MNAIAISVVTPVYNGEKYLKETIESVLSQSFGDFEFIIVDDGSTDRSADIVASFRDPRIVYIHQQNTGNPGALNRGLFASRGKYVARLDADDLCMPGRFQVQYDFLENNPDYSVCGSCAEMIDKDGETVFVSKLPATDEEIRKVFDRENCMVHSSIFFRRETAFNLGGYNEDIRLYFTDWLFMFTLTKHGKVYNFPRPLVRYRMVHNSIHVKIRNTRMRDIGKSIIKRGRPEQAELDYLDQLEKSVNLSATDKTYNYYIMLAKLYRIEAGNLGRCFHYLGLAFRTKPLAFRYMSSALIQIFSPQSLIKYIRKNFY